MRKKMGILWGYVEYIKDENVKMSVVDKEYPQESVPQSNSSWGEAIWVEHPPYSWNTKMMKISRSSLRGMVGTSATKEYDSS